MRYELTDQEWSAIKWMLPNKPRGVPRRSEEHTSELQSRLHLVCRLLLEKKKTHTSTPRSTTVRHGLIAAYPTYPTEVSALLPPSPHTTSTAASTDTPTPTSTATPSPPSH